MKIAYDIGHMSYKDQGAVSTCGLTEHQFWAGVAPILRELTTEAGHEVEFFRRQDYASSISQECSGINAWGADIAISLHLNSSDNPKCKGGHEIVHYDGSAKGKNLALYLDQALDTLSLVDRNTRTPFNGRGDTFLTKTSMPAVILELAFLSVPSDVQFIKENYTACCIAIVKGIDLYAKALRTPPKKTTTEPPETDETANTTEQTPPPTTNPQKTDTTTPTQPPQTEKLL